MHELLLFEKLDMEIKQNPPKAQNETVLSVIGREYDEDLISRLVAYTIEQDQELQKNLLLFYFEKAQKNAFNGVEIALDGIKTEQSMDDGRADIFAVFNEESITLTIENKIKTWEHETGRTSQTKAYQKYVEEKYGDKLNAFLYLKPNWNNSKPESDKFVIIDYSDLANMISEDAEKSSSIIKDFKEHIKTYLGDKKMQFTKIDEQISRNIKPYTDAINSYKKKIKEFKNELTQTIKEGIQKRLNISAIFDHKEWGINENDNREDLFCECENTGSVGIGSFRLYKREWRNIDYYFYVEIKFDEGYLEKITFQETLYNPSNNDIIKAFSDSITQKNKWKEKDSNYYVYKLKKYSDKIDLLDCEKWKERFVEEAINILCKYLEDSELYKGYKKFKSENML